MAIRHSSTAARKSTHPRSTHASTNNGHVTIAQVRRKMTSLAQAGEKKVRNNPWMFFGAALSVALVVLRLKKKKSEALSAEN